MENTIAKDIVKNKEVAPVIDQVAKHSVNGGAIALAVAGIAVAGYCIWKGVPKLKEACDAKKEADEAAAQEHEFYVPNP